MYPVNVFNLALYVLLGLILLWGRAKISPATMVVLGSLVLHGLLFNGVFIYRDLTWASCPPECGLQVWSYALRNHGLLAIIMTAITHLVKK